MTALTAAAIFMAAGLAMPCRADVPAALDRVPTNAAVVVAFTSLGGFTTKWNTTAEALGLGGDQNPMAMANMLLELPGLNKAGSGALAVFPNSENHLDPEGDEPDMLVIAPVAKYADFIKALGGEAGEGVVSVTLNEEPAFAKDIGGGYAALSKSEEVLTKFDGKGGNLAAHTGHMGARGRRVADRSDALLFASVDAVRPMLDKGLEQMNDNIGMAMTMIQNPDAAKGMAAVQGAMTDAVRDAEWTVIGLGLGDAGVSFDFSAQFKEGTEVAGFFGKSGGAGKYAANLPSQPYLFAMAMDMASPQARRLVKAMSSMGGNEAASIWGNLGATIDKINGMAMSMGATPGMLAGGMLANTVVYVDSSDPAAVVKAHREASDNLNGKSVQGIEYTTKYEVGAAEVGGRKVNRYSMTMTPGENAENTEMVQQMQMMMYGTGTPGGYIAQTESGVYMTMAPNSKVLEQSFEAATGGPNFTTDELTKGVAARLPEDRMMEIYVGTKQVLDMVSGVMMMFGGGADIPQPPQLTPVGMALSSESGGMQFSLYMPHDVIKTFQEIGKQMGGGMGGDEGGEPEAAPKEDQKPRF